MSPRRTHAHPRHPRSCLATLAWALAACCLAAPPSDPPSSDVLNVTHKWGLVATYRLHPHDGEYYISPDDLTRLFRNIDHDAQTQFDIDRGYFMVTLRSWEIIFYRDQAVFRYGHDLVQADRPLAMIDGQLMAPLSTIQRILEAFGARSQVRAKPADAPGAPTPAADAAPDILAPTPTVAPAPTEPDDRSLAPDVQEIVELLRMLGPSEAAQDLLGRRLRRTAERLADRRLVVLDMPEAPPPSAPDGDMALRTLYRVAAHCRGVLEVQPHIEVIVDPAAPGRPRLGPPETDDLLCVLALRIDASPFPDAQGARVYVAHMAVDPVALSDYAGIVNTPDRPDHAYLPYQEASLALGQTLEQRLLRDGVPRGPRPLQIAPIGVLRRSPCPAVMLSMGCWTNASDRERLGSSESVQKLGGAAALSLIQFQAWVREVAQQ